MHKRKEINKEMSISITLTVNGEKYKVEVEPWWSLAYVLREKLHLTGTKIMCNNGACGSCTVLLDGKPVSSCLKMAVLAEGKDITTIEGLADLETGKLHPLQEAFINYSGMQCGVCTPGMILTAKALLDENPTPTEDEVREALAGNLCRCGNYKRITQCILVAADKIKGGTKCLSSQL
jgi:carbon-monoxide dehydrogenase small subunit